MKANYLVCYDIRDDKRLRKIFNFTRRYGIHLQYSVFYCRFTWSELQDFKSRLNEMIDKKRDDIRIYPLPHRPLVETLGCSDRLPEGVSIFLE